MSAERVIVIAVATLIAVVVLFVTLVIVASLLDAFGVNP